jgi:hypothetical protein
LQTEGKPNTGRRAGPIRNAEVAPTIELAKRANSVAPARQATV